MGDIFIIGGPNGAGKTTAAKKLLPEKLGLDVYLNADEIARSISPLDVDAAAFQAGRILLKRMRDMVQDGTSFAFESTLSGKSYLKLLKDWQELGWHVTLIYLWLPTPEHSLWRVARRVRAGGHGIPEETIRRRYLAGLRNATELYLPLADEVKIYDNGEGLLQPVARRRSGGTLEVVDISKWERIQEILRETPEF